MTNRTHWNDETLMAWADGELSDELMQALEAEMVRDEALAERAALMMETRVLAQTAWNAELLEPVPDALQASVIAMVEREREKNAVTEQLASAPDPLPHSGAISHGTSWLTGLQQWLQSFTFPIPMALAASALCAGLGYFVGSALQEPNAAQLAQAAPIHVGQPLSPLLVQALTQAASGVAQHMSDGSQLVPVATYSTAAGALCREFAWTAPSSDAVEALACQQSNGWQLQAAARILPEQGFAPAQGDSPFSVTLEQLGAAEPMTAEQEQAALAPLKR